MLKAFKSDTLQIFIGILILTICSSLFDSASSRPDPVGLKDGKNKLTFIHASALQHGAASLKQKPITVLHGQPGVPVRQVLINNLAIKFVYSEQLAQLRLAQGINAVGFLYSDFPYIAPNINYAQSQGKPNSLNYEASRTKKNQNRRDACRSNFLFTASITAYNLLDPNNPLSCDEYPFASSKQGGSGSTVAAVPLRENCSQGGVLNAFYRILGYKDGASFYVVTYPYL